MNSILRLLTIIIGLPLLAGIYGCSSGSTATSGTAGAAKASVAITFVNAHKAAVKASTLQELGIAQLILDMIPANASSFKPASLDLVTVYNSGTTSTIDNLTDNETYLFRVMALDSANNFLYGGQTTVVIQGSTPVSLSCYQFSGFSAVTGTWNGMADTSATVSGTVGNVAPQRL